MSITKLRFKELVQQFNFKSLFQDLGWDNFSYSSVEIIDDVTYQLAAIKEKSGFKVLLCTPLENIPLPTPQIRKQLETKVRKLFHEHLIIFIDYKKQEQIWQLAVSQLGKPVKLYETRYFITQEPELLYQRISGAFFTLDEEDNINIVDVTKKMAANYQQNSEKVTKKFYDEFKKQHAAFRDFIKGIEDKVNIDWYASLMLNRLMFCYFIQKKGFLDNNKCYLRDKLLQCQFNKGSNEFYSFYRNFLLVLFHKGLGEPKHDDLITEFGKIPYLNGGLFDEHEIEKLYKDKIQVDDAAFDKVFDFFDKYEWHLDTRFIASGRDINPDVLGCIFEQYINERAQMGAYYTKEDITDYIGKNTIIPWLFDEVQRHYKEPFKPEGEIWTLLISSGDEYIYPAVKYGIKPNDVWGDLPEDVIAGFDPEQDDLIEKRKCWNAVAPNSVALVTEIWRDVIDRRKKYTEIRCKIENGEFSQINDMITFNLNIRQFIQDLIERTDDPKLIMAIYKALCKISILDPTCGSGAFLFAAMNILEDLYEACIMRMLEFTDGSPKGKNRYFEDVLAAVYSPVHPNLKYFIYKSIILNNLYGVDIMNEAVEIAKLRLFLKLVACVDVDLQHANYGLEPLPDIDFNIRCGNSLVGYANKEEIDNHIHSDVGAKVYERKIQENCEAVALAFIRYKEIQLSESSDYIDFKAAKEDLNFRLCDLTSILDEMLYKNTSSIGLESWRLSHQPFHWFAEFYEIIHDNDGFDVNIGNPPYVVTSEKGTTYKLTGYKTNSCRNLYAYTSERALILLHKRGRFGFILPNSSISAELMKPLQDYLIDGNQIWISNFSWRPSKLFEGADMLLSIIVLIKNQPETIYSTRYHKWYNEFRPFLFETIQYFNAIGYRDNGSIAKLPSELYKSIVQKQELTARSRFINSYFIPSHTDFEFYYFRAVQYWVKLLAHKPVFIENGVPAITGEMKPVYVENEDLKYCLLSILSSTTYFLHYMVWASCQVINSRDFKFRFDFNQLSLSSRSRLISLGKALQTDLIKNSVIIERQYSKKGRVFTMHKQHFYIKLSKEIIDAIDYELSRYYGFTNEEFDFIINYDIKYRMGKELDDGM